MHLYIILKTYNFIKKKYAPLYHLRHIIYITTKNNVHPNQGIVGRCAFFF
jgi:hypothetical protein